MKLQKVLVGFIGIVISVIVGVSSASAQVTCFSGLVNDVSLIPAFESETTSKYAVRIRCEDVSDVWTGTNTIQYLLTSEMGAAGYAMILTAMTADKKVFFIAQAKTTNSLITKLSIKN